MSREHQTLKEKELQTGPKASHGYGGKFGVEQDRMDKVSAGLPVPGSVACVALGGGTVAPRTFQQVGVSAGCWARSARRPRESCFPAALEALAVAGPERDPPPRPPL